MFATIRLVSRYPRSLAAAVLLGAAGALLIAGAQPFAVNLIPSPWDKLAHFAVFGTVGAALAILLGVRRWAVALAAAACATLLGGLDEWHQLALPGRNPGWDDFAADAVGALAGALLACAHRRFKLRQTHLEQVP
jgi:VanZ family protein